MLFSKTDKLTRDCAQSMFSSFVKNTSLSLAIAAFSLLTANSAQAGPQKLSLTELDTISAGYVNIYADATAEADGIDAVAVIDTLTTQVISEPDENGYVYTDSVGIANALAEGQTVYTAVNVGFDTDEEIVSFEFAHSLETSSEVVPASKAKAKHKKKKHNKNKKKKHNKKRKNKNTVVRLKQQESGYIRVVTRRPAENVVSAPAPL